MPPRERPDSGPWSRARLAAEGVVLTAIFPWVAVGVLTVFGLGAVGTIILDRAATRRLRALAASRSGEDIGSFAWAFRHKAVDMWAVRAVWEALAPWTSIPEGHVPLRPDDYLITGLDVDPEDLFDVVNELADRLDLSIGQDAIVAFIEEDPTTGDLVEFLGAQVRRSVALPSSSGR
jgi:hypothetical protein